MSEIGVALQDETPRWRLACRRIWRQVWFYRLRRWLPRLVWVGDEIDVTITWIEDALPPEGLTEADDPFAYLYRGGIYEIETSLHNMGVEFDKGIGCGGRDWEFDWSLKGPVHVAFRGRAKHPERRVSRRPRLVSAKP